MTQDRFKVGFGMLSTPKINTGQIRGFVKIGNPGNNPPLLLENDDFLDYVAFHVKCDSIQNGSLNPPIKMSQKKCRFCD